MHTIKNYWYYTTAFKKNIVLTAPRQDGKNSFMPFLAFKYNYSITKYLIKEKSRIGIRVLTYSATNCKKQR